MKGRRRTRVPRLRLVEQCSGRGGDLKVKANQTKYPGGETGLVTPSEEPTRREGRPPHADVSDS